MAAINYHVISFLRSRPSGSRVDAARTSIAFIFNMSFWIPLQVRGETMIRVRNYVGLVAIALASVAVVAAGQVSRTAPQELAFQGTKPMPPPPGGGVAFQGTKPMPPPPGGGVAFQGTKPMPPPPGGGVAFQGTKPMPPPPGGGVAFQGTKPMPPPPGGGVAFQGTKPMPPPPGGGVQA